jgi:nitrite reductase/ring-hydroxylating ferredoxin subunit
MRRRLVAHIKEKTADLEGDPYFVPFDNYTDPNRFEAERRAFRSLPLLAGLSVEIPNSGDRILFEEAGPSIIIVRGEDGVARAFLNVCPHRGSRLIADAKGGSRFSCPFHAWTFDLCGELVGRPRDDAFATDAPSRPHLVPVPIEEFAGLIFVRADPGGDALDVADYLGKLAPLLEAMDLEVAEVVRSESMGTTETNWKLAMDTFCEGYHVPVVHGRSLGGNVVPFVTIDDDYGLHHRYVGPGRDLEALVDKPESEWPDSPYSGVHYIFPNTTLSYTPSIDGVTPVFTLFRLFPGESVGRSICLYSTFRPRGDDTNESRTTFVQMHEDLYQVVENEDFVTAASTWKGMCSAPPGQRVVFGRNEAILRRFHQALAEYVGLPLE